MTDTSDFLLAYPWPTPPGDPYSEGLNIASYLAHVGAGTPVRSITQLEEELANLERDTKYRAALPLRYQLAVMLEKDPRWRDSVQARNNWFAISHYERSNAKPDRSIAADAVIIYLARRSGDGENYAILRSLSKASITAFLDPETQRAEHLLHLADQALSSIDGPAKFVQAARSVHHAALETLAYALELPPPPASSDIDYGLVANELYGLAQSLNALPHHALELQARLGQRASELFEEEERIDLAAWALGYTAESYSSQKRWRDAIRCNECILELRAEANLPLDPPRLEIGRAALELRDRTKYETAMAQIRKNPPTNPVNYSMFAFLESEAVLQIERNGPSSAKIADLYIPRVEAFVGDNNTPRNDEILRFFAFLLHNRLYLKGASEAGRTRDARAAAQIYINRYIRAKSLDDSADMQSSLNNLRNLFKTFGRTAYSGASAVALKDLVVQEIKGTLEEEIVMSIWEVAAEAASFAIDTSVSACESLFTGFGV